MGLKYVKNMNVLKLLGYSLCEMFTFLAFNLIFLVVFVMFSHGRSRVLDIYDKHSFVSWIVGDEN